MINAILPNCDTRAMEGIIGSLGKRNIPIIGLSTHPECSAFRSKYVIGRVKSPSPIDGEGFLNFLMKAPFRGVLFAPDDHTAILFSANQEKLKKNGFLTNFPPITTLLTGFDKWRCYLEASRFGIPCAFTRLIEGPEKLDALSRSMDYPFIIKATTLAGGNYIKVYKQEEVLDAYIKMKEAISRQENRVLHPRLIAQEWLDYDMEDIWCVEAYYDRYGTGKGFFPVKKIRTVIYRRGTFGSRLYAGESFPNEKVVALTRTLLDALEWKGLAHVDWVYSRNKSEYYLTEINPRLPGFSFFPSQAGFEMAYYYYADLTGGTITCHDVKPFLYFESLRYPGDISSAISAIFRRQYSWKKLIKSYARIFTEGKPIIIDFFNISDIRMTMANVVNIMRIMVKELKQSISKKRGRDHLEKAIHNSADVVATKGKK
jgi:predicted ATP-grasp superfamily ATP-dependent carboligase